MNSSRDDHRLALPGATATIWLAACLAVPSASAQPAGAEAPVKMSRTGICHERGTVHYQQTIYFQPFDSMEACLKAGGRQMGGDYANDAPRFAYRGTHPLSNYWPYVVVGVIVAWAAFVGIALPLWRRWKERQTQRAFANREKQHWEGHKLEPKRRRR